MCADSLSQCLCPGLIDHADVMSDWWVGHTTESAKHGLDVRLRLCDTSNPLDDNAWKHRWVEYNVTKVHYTL